MKIGMTFFLDTFFLTTDWNSIFVKKIKSRKNFNFLVAYLYFDSSRQPTLLGSRQPTFWFNFLLRKPLNFKQVFIFLFAGKQIILHTGQTKKQGWFVDILQISENNFDSVLKLK